MSRDSRRALVWLVDGTQLRGTVYLLPGARTTDLLNRRAEDFLAITDATVSRAGREERFDFIAVNKSHIMAVFELATDQ